VRESLLTGLLAAPPNRASPRPTVVVWTKRLCNALVGELKLTADALELPGEDVTLIVYTAPADSPEQEKLDFLSRWAGGVPPPGTADLSTEPVPKT